jgi:hypothetical protein
VKMNVSCFVNQFVLNWMRWIVLCDGCKGLFCQWIGLNKTVLIRFLWFLGLQCIMINR